MSEFSDRLKSYRAKHGLTQAEMGAKLGVGGNYIYQLESGAKKPSDAVQNLLQMLEDSAHLHHRMQEESSVSSSILREEGPRYGARTSPYAKISTTDLQRELELKAQQLGKARGLERINLMTVLRQLLAELEERPH